MQSAKFESFKNLCFSRQVLYSSILQSPTRAHDKIAEMSQTFLFFFFYEVLLSHSRVWWLCQTERKTRSLNREIKITA